MDNFWSLVHDQQFDTLIFKIGQSWKVWPSCWPMTPKEGSDVGVTMNNFWSLVQDLQSDTSTIEIWQSWKFDLSVDLWPRRKGRTSGSQWQLLILGPRPTIWHINRWNQTKLKVWPFCWPLTPKKGLDVGVTVTTFDPWAKTYNLTPQPSKSDKVENLTFLVTFDLEERVGRRGHHDNFHLLGQDKQFDTSTVAIGQSWKFNLSGDLWPWRKGWTSRSPWQFSIVGQRRTILHMNCRNRTKFKIWLLIWPLWPHLTPHIFVTP